MFHNHASHLDNFSIKQKIQVSSDANVDLDMILKVTLF